MTAGRASAVTFYPLDHPALNITGKNDYAKKLHNERVDLGDGLAKDFADYRYRCGRIAVLRETVEWFDERLKEVDR